MCMHTCVVFRVIYSNTLATWCKELTHWKRPWCWDRLKAGGEGNNRGWDDWMTSLTQWTWVWVSSGSWWWTEGPGVLQSMGLQRVGHDSETELNWTEWGFPGSSDGKESPCSARHLGSIPGLGKSPGEGNCYPLQYSCLENSMERGAWQATVLGVHKELEMTEQLTLSLSLNWMVWPIKKHPWTRFNQWHTSMQTVIWNHLWQDWFRQFVSTIVSNN